MKRSLCGIFNLLSVCSCHRQFVTVPEIETVLLCVLQIQKKRTWTQTRGKIFYVLPIQQQAPVKNLWSTFDFSGGWFRPVRFFCLFPLLLEPFLVSLVTLYPLEINGLKTALKRKRTGVWCFLGPVWRLLVFFFFTPFAFMQKIFITCSRQTLRRVPGLYCSLNTLQVWIEEKI